MGDDVCTQWLDMNNRSIQTKGSSNMYSTIFCEDTKGAEFTISTGL